MVILVWKKIMRSTWCFRRVKGANSLIFVFYIHILTNTHALLAWYGLTVVKRLQWFMILF